MKTSFTRQKPPTVGWSGLLSFLLVLGSLTSFAGGACENASQFPTSAVTVSGTDVITINSCNFEEEYTQLTGIIAGASYEFTADGPTTYITIRQGSVGGAVLAAGFSPLTGVAATAEDIYVHWNADASCAVATNCITTTVQNVTPPCDMSGESGQWPSGTITVGAVGVQTTISGVQYAGSEYAVVDGFIAGNFYELGHEAGSYITVREGVVDGPVVAAGFSPLQFTATSSATLYVHYTADAICTVDATGSWDTYVTNLGLPPCDMSGENGQYPFGAVTVDAAGALTTIATDQYDGSEYSQVTGIAALHDYEFTHENGAFITVYSGGVTGSLVGSGFSPLTITAPNSNDLYVHWTIDDACTVGTSTADFYLTTVQDVTVPGTVCDVAIPVACGDVVSGNTNDGNVNAGLGTCGTSLTSAPGLWYAFEGNGQDIVASLCGSSFDTKMGVFSGDCNALVCEGGNDDACSTQSEVSFYAEAGTTYYIYVTGFSSNAGAFDLSVTCTCPALDAGSLTADASPVCLDGGSAVISASENTPPALAVGYTVTYVLTSGGTDYVIEAVNATPDFTVTEGGDYTIHTLVSTSTLDLSGVVFGTTTAADVLGIVAGDDNICAALDVTGAPITVEDPQAGTLTADATPVALCAGGTADISATEGVAPNVPAGYEVVYALTEGAGLVIIDAAATPEFTVDAVGDYTIHTLVYNPATLDLTSVVFGTTTGFDVNGLLVQGGGSICGSLDVTGAPISVVEPDAGTLTIDASPVCLDGGSAIVSATEADAPVVPAGYEVVYALTEGAGLVIIDAGATPEFTVNAAGDYTIHTLVYDPNTLDLNSVVLGTTTGFDVNGLLVQGGGSICGSLDVAGAPVTVEGPTAGTLTADASPVCLQGGSADISATEGDAPTVPTDYEVLYVLTEGAGLVIIDAGATPEFTVNAAGDYTIHTLVYNPATLDVTGVVFGTTTGFDVNGLLVQGGGSICGALDVTGAPITVEDCTPANDLCSGAETVNCGDVLVGNTTYATADDAPTGVSEGVWYTITGTGDDITVSTCTGTTWDTEIVVSEGTCGSLTLVGNNDDACGLQSSYTFSSVSGTVYYIYVGDYSSTTGAGGNSGEFELTVSCAAPPDPLANDFPCDAIALAEGLNGSYTNVGATADTWEAGSIPAGTGTGGSCESQDGWCSFELGVDNSTWFTFVAPASGKATITLDGFDTQAALFSGASCQDIEAGNGTLVAANDDNPAGGLASFLSLCDLNPGETYYLMVDGYDGEEGTYTVTLTFEDLVADFTSSASGLVVDFTDASTTTNTVVAWAWDFDDAGATADVAAPQHTFSADGTYNVCLTVTDENGCDDTYCADVTVQDITTSITEVLERSTVVYPNPSNGAFTLEITGVESMAQMNVLDLTGRVVYTEGAMLNGNFRTEVNLNVASGTYLLQVVTEEGMVTRKLQIK